MNITRTEVKQNKVECVYNVSAGGYIEPNKYLYDYDTYWHVIDFLESLDESVQYYLNEYYNSCDNDTIISALIEALKEKDSNISHDDFVELVYNIVDDFDNGIDWCEVYEKGLSQADILKQFLENNEIIEGYIEEKYMRKIAAIINNSNVNYNIAFIENDYNYSHCYVGSSDKLETLQVIADNLCDYATGDLYSVEVFETLDDFINNQNGYIEVITGSLINDFERCNTDNFGDLNN